MKPLSLFLRSLCSLTFASATLAVHAAEHATITLYHHISDSTPASTSVPPDKFREQMEHLKADGFHVMPLPELLSALQQRQEVPDKTVAITFDDGYISIYDTAFPMLQEYGFPFTVFINTQPHNDRMNGYMSWEQIREMSDAGVTFANHMENHPYMVDALAGEDEAARIARLRAELLRSQDRITAETGQDHKFMAYPYGEYDVPVKRMMGELGFIGLGQHSGAVGFDSDFLALARYPFGGSFTDLNDFKQKVQTLSFNLLEVDPETPMTTETNPSVTLQFGPGNFNNRQIGCYAGGQPLQMEWLDQENGRVRISTEQHFNTRRFRYLCTAPATGMPGRFYWYSKDWTRSTPNNQD
ncbi:MAG: polysaccharide deacetylase family protein [Gammaproteobacteria bacterium]|nr:polysaccharide deacetylase family protein [Gammaproteobacteria bacterium]MDP2141005.1 polysaccharide deacetylase family protein [Gammaproteobacteria bacterium]MDP2349251.1 polysaccharide deacetylase family protein [Gammaproteobacteria bacterium]